MQLIEEFLVLLLDLGGRGEPGLNVGELGLQVRVLPGQGRQVGQPGEEVPTGWVAFVTASWSGAMKVCAARPMSASGPESPSR